MARFASDRLFYFSEFAYLKRKPRTYSYKNERLWKQEDNIHIHTHKDMETERGYMLSLLLI